MRQTRHFAHEAESVPAARHFATAALSGAPSDTIEVVELLVSEIASNCIRHTDSAFELTIARDTDEIRVEATDLGYGTPTRRSPAVTDLSGRGLQIVDMLSASWGYEPHAPSGKTVWFTIRVEAEIHSPAR